MEFFTSFISMQRNHIRNKLSWEPLKIFYCFYLFFHTTHGLLNKKFFPFGEQAIGNWKLLYTDNNIFYQQNIKKKELFNFDKYFVIYDNHNGIIRSFVAPDSSGSASEQALLGPAEYNKIELNIYPDYENKNDTFPKLLLKIKKYEKQNMITYSKIINCNLFMSSCEEIDDLEEIEENKQCSLIILKSEKMIKSFGIFEFPHITFLYKSAMIPTYAITWKIDTQLNRLYIYFNKNTYVFEREFYDEMIMNKQSITTNTFIVTNIISFIMCKLLEKIFDGH